MSAVIRCPRGSSDPSKWRTISTPPKATDGAKPRKPCHMPCVGQGSTRQIRRWLRISHHRGPAARSDLLASPNKFGGQDRKGASPLSTPEAYAALRPHVRGFPPPDTPRAAFGGLRRLLPAPNPVTHLPRHRRDRLPNASRSRFPRVAPLLSKEIYLHYPMITRIDNGDRQTTF